MINNKECHTPWKGHRELNSMAVVLGEQENKQKRNLIKKNCRHIELSRYHLTLLTHISKNLFLTLRLFLFSSECMMIIMMIILTMMIVMIKMRMMIIFFKPSKLRLFAHAVPSTRHLSTYLISLSLAFIILFT